MEDHLKPVLYSTIFQKKKIDLRLSQSVEHTETSAHELFDKTPQIKARADRTHHILCRVLQHEAL